jgi:antitoxin ParD1/3/4
MPTMNVNLPDDLAEFVAEQIRDGGYGNQSEVARDGLRLLRARRDKRRALLAALEAGHADIAAGRTKPLTRELLREIAERAAERATRSAADDDT